MKKFLLLRQQSGEGCDYSIECGTQVEFLFASSKEEAISKIMDLHDDWRVASMDHDNPDDYLHGLLSYESGLHKINDSYKRPVKTLLLIEISEKTDLIPIFQEKINEITSFIKERSESKKIEKEIQLFNELKKKYENN